MNYGKSQMQQPMYGMSAGAPASSEALQNMLFERQMKAKELENMAEGLMSQNPEVQKQIQMELTKRYRLNPAQKAAMQMFSPSEAARSV